MTQINQLSAVTALAAGDNFPLYSASNGDARRVSLTLLAGYIAAHLVDGAGDSLALTEYVKTVASTVALLPSAVTSGAGARAMVSDATATTFASAVAGGGANIVPVYSDGTIWRIG